MQFWENIVNTALIGTKKKQITVPDMPAELQELLKVIEDGETSDREEKFLRIAAVAFNYRQSGTLPLQKKLSTSVAPDETKPYCTPGSLQVLKDILNAESIPLVKFWLEQCSIKQALISPDMLPVMLDLGSQHKILQGLIAQCSGKRGEWLSGLNEDWNFNYAVPLEELWQTGVPEQRKFAFKETRKHNAALGREWLQQTWPHEDATAKLAFPEMMPDNISEEDIPFLQGLSSEKSKKVKDQALILLKRIPGSDIVQNYKDVLAQSVTLKKEKALLGMMSKTTLDFSLPANYDASIHKTGIEKLSSDKIISDEEFILYQLIQSVPPSFWTAHLNISPESLLDLLQKDKKGKIFMPALATSIAVFHGREWAEQLARQGNACYPDIVPVLPDPQKDMYCTKCFDDFPNEIVAYATWHTSEWSPELAKKILRHTAKNSYQYNRTFYNQNIHLIPAQAIAELEKYTPADISMHSIWSNMSDYIFKLVTLKIQTIKAFNA